jgi:single-stranded DNA-specific DHH superfamily exonuclease
LPAERVEAFRADFAAVTADMRSAAGVPMQTLVDAVIGTDGYAVPPASDLVRLEPLGEANTEPVFLLSEARVDSSSAVGRGHLKLVLRAGEQRLAAFGLDMAERAPAVGSAINAVGALRPDTWQGGDQVELRLLDFD